MAWWFASSLLSLAAAGFIVGWLRQATGLNDTTIYVSTVWALTTWWRSGSQSRSLVQPRAVPTGRPAPPPEVVIRFEGRGQGLVAGDAVALRPHRVARGQELSDAVEEALAVTKERAKRLVADWEERIGRAFSELTRLAT